MSHKTLFVDPGETVGWSVWEAGCKVESGQHSRIDFADALYAAWGLYPEDAGRPPTIDDTLVEALRCCKEVVCEEYALYPWELKNLAWDKCLTPRLIGALAMACRLRDYPIHYQGAKIKDEAMRLGAGDHFVTPKHENRHQNDAIMHAVFFYGPNGAGKDRV